MAGYKLGIGIGDGDHGFIEVIVFHASGAPKSAGASHIAALSGSVRAILGHADSLV